MSEKIATTEINIAPKTNVYAVFRKLNYEQASAYAEFIDNSTQSFFNNESELMSEPGYSGCIIEINHDPVNNVITIKDNCFGMDLDDFKRAVILKSVPDDTSGRNEYGMGLKTAATWFGRKWSVKSTRKGLNYEFETTIDVDILSKFMPDKVPAIVSTVSSDSHYTIITIEKLNRKFPQKKTLFALKQALGQVYCRDIQSGKVKIFYNGELVEYQYPDILITEENGKERVWKKELNFSVNYDGKEYRVSGFAAIRKKGSLKHAGFMLFRRNRAVIGGFGEKYKPEMIFGQGNSFRSQRLFGEFDLDDWPVSQTKDHFDWDAELESLFIEGVHTEIRDLEKKADSLRVRRPKSTLQTENGSKTEVNLESETETPSKEVPESKEIGDGLVPNPNSKVGLTQFSGLVLDSGKGMNATTSMEFRPVTEELANSEKFSNQTHCDANHSRTEYTVNYLGDQYTFTIILKPLSSEALFSKSTNKNHIEITINLNHKLTSNFTSSSKDMLIKLLIYLSLAEKIVDLDSVEGSIAPSSIRDYLNIVSKCSIEEVQHDDPDDL